MREKRRQFQFSLRTLFVGTMFLAIVFWAVVFFTLATRASNVRSEWKKAQETVSAIRKAVGVTATNIHLPGTTDLGRTPLDRVVRYMIGKKYYDRVGCSRYGRNAGRSASDPVVVT